MGRVAFTVVCFTATEVHQHTDDEVDAIRQAIEDRMPGEVDDIVIESFEVIPVVDRKAPTVLAAVLDKGLGVSKRKKKT